MVVVVGLGLDCEIHDQNAVKQRYAINFQVRWDVAEPRCTASSWHFSWLVLAPGAGSTSWL
ncbi:hypothetical protein AB0G04_13505 [Actinoplanes sp. NPDC023801]|uniref:hypothetical protein n=1 Tax=Actinoplanes sp. NPDC023801 TaxID=3154595 RepID=UPI00340CBC12